MAFYSLIRSFVIYNQAMIAPGQASETLNIPTSTLRRLAKEFQEYLSPQTGRKRSYTIEDLDTFRKIRELLDAGMTYEDIKPRLQIVESKDDQPRDLAIIPELINQLKIASETVQKMRSEMDQQDQRIKGLEDWIALPWYGKIITKPPGFINPPSD